jgi:3-hydroxymyristoyl/3-hydroxydecanoyl-(acyl carrier protein) dehydratase
MTYDDILNTIPHRHPFLFVDKVLEIIPRERIVAQKMYPLMIIFSRGISLGIR